MKHMSYLGLLVCSLSLGMNLVSFGATGDWVNLGIAIFMVPFIVLNFSSILEERKLK